MMATISIPKSLKEKAKKKAYKRGSTFSGFIRVLLEKELRKGERK